MPARKTAKKAAKKVVKKKVPARVRDRGDIAPDELLVKPKNKPKPIKGELQDLMKDIDKTYGVGRIRRASQLPRFNHIPTGIFLLDFALLGGFAEGLPAMLYGMESSGKTTGAMKAIANFQHKHPNKRVAFVDPENTFDPLWAETQGVDTENLVYADPESGEKAVDLVDAFSRTAEIGMIVLDSIPALVPMKLVEDSAADANVALVARLMGKLCSKLSQSAISERKRGHTVTFLSINQFRARIGGPPAFGVPKMLPGGFQSNFFHMTKVELANYVKLGKDRHGFETPEFNEHKFKITKSKVGASIRNGEFVMIANPDHELGQGTIMDAKTVGSYAKKLGIITGNSPKIRLEPWDLTFKKQDELFDAIEKNTQLSNYLKHHCIAKQRENKGLPALPPDGYLVDYNAGEVHA